MLYGGEICCNGYFYEMTDGNVFYEYTSRNVKHEQYQNQWTYDTLLNMVNSGMLTYHPVTYSYVPCEGYINTNNNTTFVTTGSTQEPDLETPNTEEECNITQSEPQRKNQRITGKDKRNSEPNPKNKKLRNEIIVETVVTDDEQEPWEQPKK